MEILIDAREQGEKYSLGTRKDRAQKHYNELGYSAIIAQLDYGDYLFNNETVFEYKTIVDLMSSIRDKSVFEEVANQTLPLQFPNNRRRHQPLHRAYVPPPTDLQSLGRGLCCMESQLLQKILWWTQEIKVLLQYHTFDERDTSF